MVGGEGQGGQGEGGEGENKGQTMNTLRNNRPAILQVLHTLEVGGAEMLAARLARRLRDRFRFVFVCLDGLGTLGAELQREGFVVEVLHRKPGIDLACVRQLASTAERHGADLIQAHQYTPFFYARAPGWLGRRLPVVFTEHGRMCPDLPNHKRMFFNRVFLRSSDRVVAVGEAVKKALIVNEGIPARRIQVIYNGVRLADFASNPTLRATVRSNLGIGPNAAVAIQVARLDAVKDHGTALRAARRIKTVRPDFQLLLVGEGPERTKIEQEIDALELRGTARLLGLRTDVQSLLSVADVFLLTSISEGIPVTLIEAMAARLPVVSTDVGGIREVVSPGVTGWLAPARDDELLAAHLLRLFEKPEEVSRMIQAGETRARQLFSEQQMHSAYAQLFNEMLPDRARRREQVLTEVAI